MPANGDVVVDTSVVIPYFRGDDAIRTQLLAVSAVYLPQAALGELYCGAYLCGNPSHALTQIQKFLAAVHILLPESKTAEHYGRIRAQLAKAGTPIPENDIWIAALAIENQMPLAARDAHFDRIPGLQVLKW